ncbi:hypothetical protein FWJ33_20240 [Leptospira interrogans serovar Hardjo]|nr:hypothetical protein FWJ33_20240 [Leptospira interrogans serovar Hardjo]
MRKVFYKNVLKKEIQYMLFRIYFKLPFIPIRWGIINSVFKTVSFLSILLTQVLRKKSIILKKLDLNFIDRFLKCRNYFNLKNKS